MGRSDVRALEAPEMSNFLPAEAAAPVKASEPSMPAAVATNPAADAQIATKLERCPHCSARLSAIDLKFDSCLSCGKGFSAARAQVINVGIYGVG
jgi:hypothetical protein